MLKENVYMLDNELAEKFELALTLNKEEANEVITRLVSEYIAESL